MNKIQISEKPCLLFIHGYGSSKDSRKFSNLKNYFQDEFDYAYMDWVPESNFEELMNSTYQKIKDYTEVIIVGDSTGANFAYQLCETYNEKAKNRALLILTSPLLNANHRLRKDEVPFIDNLKNALWEIENLEDCLIIATKDDDVVNQTWLFENVSDHVFENTHLIGVNDHHRLLEFEKYLGKLEEYIKLRLR